MTHQEAQDTIFAYATRPDGFNGDDVRVGIAFDAERNAIMEVYESGVLRSPAIPTAGSASAAEWLLYNHAEAKRFYSNVSKEAK